MIIYIVYDPGCYTTINNTYSPSSRRLVGKFMNLLYIICKLNNYNICRGGGWQYIRARDLLFVTATFCIYNTVLYSTVHYSTVCIFAIPIYPHHQRPDGLLAMLLKRNSLLVLIC
jgi:hypothetical protein